MLLKYENVVYDTENDYQLSDLVDEVLYDLKDKYIVDLWNEYCDKNDYNDENIFSMYELADYLELKGTTAYEVITGNVVDFDCFCYQEDWFIDSMWGLRSSDSPWDLVDIGDYEFKAYFEGLLLDDPEKYDCEEVDEGDDSEE